MMYICLCTYIWKKGNEIKVKSECFRDAWQKFISKATLFNVKSVCIVCLNFCLIYSNSMQISLYHSNSIQSIMFLKTFFFTPTCLFIQFFFSTPLRLYTNTSDIFKKLNSKARLLNLFDKQGKVVELILQTDRQDKALSN